MTPNGPFVTHKQAGLHSMISVLIVRQDNCHLHSTTMAYNARQIYWNSSILFSPSFLFPSMLSIICHLALNQKGIPQGCQTIIPELLLRAPPESAPCNAFTNLQEKKNYSTSARRIPYNNGTRAENRGFVSPFTIGVLKQWSLPTSVNFQVNITLRFDID